MSEHRLTTPVVLIIFNRPATTARVVAALRQVRPSQLLVVADGPRPHHPDDGSRCAAARAVIETVDWDCNVSTNFAENNLGCRDRVSTGLDWVFSQVESAIILEDDCVAHPTFFRFCTELLEHYADDQRVMAISGNNFQFGQRRTPDSYYFSHYAHCWGWATWRRAWQHYDITMRHWPQLRDQGWLMDLFADPRAVRFWTRILQATYEGRINSWAYRWTLSCWLHHGLTILPNLNLVSNIGFDAAATHTSGARHPFANLPVAAMPFPLRHPPFVIRNARADAYTQRTLFDPDLFWRLGNRLRRLTRRYA